MTTTTCASIMPVRGERFIRDDALSDAIDTVMEYGFTHFLYVCDVNSTGLYQVACFSNAPTDTDKAALRKVLEITNEDLTEDVDFIIKSSRAFN